MLTALAHQFVEIDNPALVYRLHAMFEDRLQQRRFGAEMVMQRRFIALTCRLIDLLQRDAVNAVLTKELLSGEDQPLARVAPSGGFFLLHAFHNNVTH